MKRSLLLLFVFLCSIAAAQQPLSKSLRSGSYKFIYRITANEALELYQTNLHKISDKYLHTLSDSVYYKSPLPELPQGNYLVLQAVENKMFYELVTGGDLQLKLVNNASDLAVFLHNRKGEAITGAKVTTSNKNLPYDPQTKTYRLNKWKKSFPLVVTHNNTVFYFPINKDRKNLGWIKKVWYRVINGFPIFNIRSLIRTGEFRRHDYVNYFSYPVRYERKHRSFITFNKPMYKPGDTVKLKAFVMKKNGKGIQKKLIVRLTDEIFKTDSIIGTITPYRRGGYTFEFVLNDSLDLDLDDNYLVTLEEERSRKYDLDDYYGNLDEEDYASKRKIVAKKMFRFEEYELENITFNARSDKKSHNRGNPVSVFLKATDENNLPVMDGRVEITVVPTWTSLHFDDKKIFLPDTLWRHSQSLDAVGETKIVIPDSIFPNASFSYEVIAVFLNANNERHTKSLYQKFEHQPGEITFQIQKDSLRVEYQVAGKIVGLDATLFAINNFRDTLEKIPARLPASVKLNHYASNYRVNAPGIDEAYSLSANKRSVSAAVTRTADSVFIVLDNPHQSPVWYTVFAGDKAIARGQGDSMFLALRSSTPKNYFLSLQYIFGNELFTDDIVIPYQDKILKLALNGPVRIAPGETATFEVNAYDQMNKPVEGADITAWSFTSKFPNAASPAVPYLGKSYPGRSAGHNFSWWSNQVSRRGQKLDFERWSYEMGLDTIEYYRFLYPEELYINTEAVKDSITQIAPFVVIGGEVQPVHFIYIDEKPHFFSHSQHLQRYSFQVSPGKHSLRIRTHDRIISIKDLEVPKGIKTIISLNGDSTKGRITVNSLPDTLTSLEKILLSKYTILVNHQYGEQLGYLKQDEKYFLLPKSGYQGQTTITRVGPLMPNWADLAVKDKFSQSFEVEGNYAYDIHEGFVKMKQLPAHFSPVKYLSHQPRLYNFSELVLTGDEIDSLWLDYIDSRSVKQDLFYNPAAKLKGAGRLVIKITDTARQLLYIKNVFLFRHDNPDFLNVYRGSATDLGLLGEGYYRLFFLLKNDRYHLLDSIKVQKGGVNYFAVDASRIHGRDSISIKLSDIIRKRELRNIYSPDGMDVIKESFHSAYLDSAFLTNQVIGMVIDTKGDPIPFASVLIKGTRMGTVTDANGLYRLRVPDNAVLVFASVGFGTVERNAGADPNIVMVESDLELNEVVVTSAYGIRRQSRELSYSTVRQDELFLEGRVAGLNVMAGSKITLRGARVSSGNAAPMMFINGVPFTGDLASIDPSLISDITVLSGESAVALYGASAVNGVIIITISKQKTGDIVTEENDDVIKSIRRNFRDDAFWQPVLKTNSEGKASFTATFPDDITSWKTFVVGIGGKKLSGYSEGTIRSFRPLSANLSLPQFTVEGDTLHFISKALNYGSDTITARRKISFNGSTLTEGMISIINSVIDTTTVTIPAEDSVRFQVEIEKPGYFDGEERVLPVYPQGVLETKGVFLALNNDTSVSVALNPALGKITLHAEASLFPVLLNETERLFRYEYLCNEQLASKLKALLSEKKIRELTGEKFKRDKAINDIISKLNSSRTGSLWGWWANNAVSPWISLHVVEALLQAEQAGYKVNLFKAAIIDFLVFNLESYNGQDKLLSLHLLHQLGAKADFKKYADTLSKSVSKMSLYQKLRLAELKQKVELETGIDSLVRLSRETMFGNLYWGEEGYQFFDNSIHNTVLMCRILKRQGGNEVTLNRIRNYFLEQRKSGEWRNTYESSLILETILSDILKEGRPSAPSTVSLSSLPGETINKFPFHREVNSGDTIRIEKKGDLPVYFTAYQSSWNRRPEKVSGSFAVSSVFQRSGDTISMLKAGEPVTMEVKVTVKGDADYVMIEVPVPAGCSYKEKPQPSANNEVHREYFKNKVSIFCSSLKKGNYTFYISLQPRYSGVYHLNPAKAEMMYFPVFYGREEMKKVVIR